MEKLIKVCAWCRRVKVKNGKWIELGLVFVDARYFNITHGICPDCNKKWLKKAGVKEK